VQEHKIVSVQSPIMANFWTLLSVTFSL